MMTVKELKEILEGYDDNLEVYTSIWHSTGEERQRMRLSMRENLVSSNGKYLRISWTDNCRADQISDEEYER